jgi:hypothetical protein
VPGRWVQPHRSPSIQECHDGSCSSWTTSDRHKLMAMVSRGRLFARNLHMRASYNNVTSRSLHLGLHSF